MESFFSERLIRSFKDNKEMISNIAVIDFLKSLYFWH